MPRNPLNWLAVALAVVGAGCQFDPRGNGASVVFDSDGGSPRSDGGSRADAAPSCVPSCTAASNLDTCAVETDCPLGCIADNPGAHCGEMVPSNGALAGHLAGVTRALDIAAGEEDVVIWTDTGQISGAFSRNPVEGVESGIGFYKLGSAKVAVLAVASLRIGSGAVLRGVGDNALIVLSAGDVEILGKIDFSAAECSSLGGACGGPGAGDGGYRASFATQDATGCGAGGNGQYYTGGGGGALGANGGAGGALPVTAGGTGGSASGCPSPGLSPLVGGSGGGAGGLGFEGGGGGGGGAVQLTSFTQIRVQGTLESSAVGIECSGAGGREGGNGSGHSRSGGGGGAGGAILLEAPRVIVALARLTANGGGGGAVSTEGNGEAGGFSSASANGGDDSDSEYAGGAGGALSRPTGLPGTARSLGTATGGGGGSAGIIHVRTAGGGPMLDMVTISPAHTTSSLVVR